MNSLPVLKLLKMMLALRDQQHMHLFAPQEFILLRHMEGAIHSFELVSYTLVCLITMMKMPEPHVKQKSFLRLAFRFLLSSWYLDLNNTLKRAPIKQARPNHRRQPPKNRRQRTTKARAPNSKAPRAPTDHQDE